MSNDAPSTSTELVFTHDIPTPVRLDATMVADAEAHMRALDAITEITDNNRERVDYLLRSVATSEKKLEADRKALKAGPIELGRRIDAACEGLAGRLLRSKRRAAALQDAERQRKLAEQRAAEEAQRRKVAEAQRIADERRMQDEAALAELRRQEAEGAPLTLEEVAIVDELEADAAVAREIDAIVPLPMVPEIPKSATGRRMVDTLVIDDINAIPRVLNGKELFKLDEAAVKRALKAGIEVPGCHMEKRPELAVRGF